MKQRGPWRWRRWSGRGRKPKPRFIHGFRGTTFYVPVEQVPPNVVTEIVEVAPDEIEALRLVYLEGMSQTEAARLMGISRGTLWRLLESGRRKLIEAIVSRKVIKVGEEVAE